MKQKSSVGFHRGLFDWLTTVTLISDWLMVIGSCYMAAVDWLTFNLMMIHWLIVN